MQLHNSEQLGETQRGMTAIIYLGLGKVNIMN